MDAAAKQTVRSCLFQINSLERGREWDRETDRQTDRRIMAVICVREECLLLYRTSPRITGRWVNLYTLRSLTSLNRPQAMKPHFRCQWEWGPHMSATVTNHGALRCKRCKLLPCLLLVYFVPGECRVAFRILTYDVIMVMWVSLSYFERWFRRIQFSTAWNERRCNKAFFLLTACRLRWLAKLAVTALAESVCPYCMPVSDTMLQTSGLSAPRAPVCDCMGVWVGPRALIDAAYKRKLS
jgi:hypothetical protein